MDGEAWWAAVHGVTQSRTRLKRSSNDLIGIALTWEVEDTQKDQAIFQALGHLERPTHFLSLHSICCP